MSFEDAQAAMSGYARNFEEMSKELGGKQQDLESAMEIDDIVGDIPESGIEGIDNALEYIEGTFTSKSNIADSILKSSVTTPEDKARFLEDWQEKRSIRDALYQEKQKRIEQLKQFQQATEKITKGRASALSNIENLYAQAGVPEDTPSRQKFLRKMQGMSPDEIHFLSVVLRKAGAEFSKIGDSKLLAGLLMGLNSESFKHEDVTKRRAEEDQRELEQLRAQLGIEGEAPTKTLESGRQSGKPAEAPKAETTRQLPGNDRDMMRYVKDNFTKIEGLSLDEFRKALTPEVEHEFQMWAKQKVGILIKDKPQGGRYPDNVASIFGNNAAFLQRVVAIKEGGIVDYDELLTMPFSEVAKRYLNIDLPKNYFDTFSPRGGSAK